MLHEPLATDGTASVSVLVSVCDTMICVSGCPRSVYASVCVFCRVCVSVLCCVSVRLCPYMRVVVFMALCVCVCGGVYVSLGVLLSAPSYISPYPCLVRVFVSYFDVLGVLPCSHGNENDGKGMKKLPLWMENVRDGIQEWKS